ELARQKMARFADGRTPARFFVCTLVLVGLSALPALSRAGTPRQAPYRLLGLLWTGAFLVFLVATATFWSRHFLHALPGLLLAAAPGLDGWQRRRAAFVALWLLASAALGLGWTLFNLARGPG